MIIRSLAEATSVEWGNGQSRRFLVEGDGLGYTLTDTIVYPGTCSGLQYLKHLEACYCVEGRGAVIDSTGVRHVIEPGTMYLLDQHDAHYLMADEDSQLRLVCVFTPALRGDETHVLTADQFSGF